MRHSPKDRGKIVRVELALIGADSLSNDGARRRESLQSTIGKRSPLIEVVHERAFDKAADLLDKKLPRGLAELEKQKRKAQSSLLIVRFRKTTDFEIRPGSAARSLVVFMKAAAPSTAKAAPKPSAVEKAKDSSRSSEIMAEGRKAMTAKEYTRAAALFELALSTEATAKTERDNQREAKELLGLARERNGQAAHARAEYEEYLDQYPEGEGADRVRQRLQALMTAEALPTPLLREAKPREDEDWFEVYGDASIGYYREEILTGDADDRVYESLLISDLNVTGRAEVSGYDLIGDLSLSHDHDFVATTEKDETRVSVLSLEGRSPGRSLSGIIGRQTRRDAGVLGRFDGAIIESQIHDHVELSGVFGFPLETTTSSGLNEDRIFFGSAADFEGYIEGATAQVFAIGQMNHELIDRIAIGTELHYVGTWGYARGFLDYDAYFNSLNLALLSASVNIGKDWQLHSFLQTQTVPFLTLANALQGQTAEDLDELRDDFSKSEIKNLAEDRTARSYTVTVGGSHWLNKELQIAADLSFITVGGTKRSGGVPKSSGTDADVSANVQVTKNSLFMTGDIVSGSLRYTNGDLYDRYGLFLRSRIPLHRKLYIDPRVTLDFRDHLQGGSDQLSIRPTAQLTYDWYDFTFEFEAGLDTLQQFGDQASDPEVSYLIEMLVRYEF
ncbi:MAG: hypothetical protein GY944_07790 [bacterium]|nr:hypothetical protein [bacterium]